MSIELFFLAMAISGLLSGALIYFLEKYLEGE